MKNRTISIGNSRIKKELNKDLCKILNVDQSPIIEINVKNDRIVGWQLKRDKTPMRLLNKKTEHEIEEIVFYLGSLIIDEHNSNVELHVDKIKAYEVSGKVFKDQLTVAQQIALGVKDLHEDLMLEFEAEVETQWGYDIVNAYVSRVLVFSSDDKLKVELQSCQYDASSIEESLQEFNSKYEEDAAARHYDRISDYD